MTTTTPPPQPGTLAHDPHKMFRAAQAFFLAGERCGPLLKPLGMPAPSTLTTPLIVNYAIALEIALKALYGIASGFAWKPPKGSPKAASHDLKLIFEALPAGVQARLIGPRWERKHVDSALALCKDSFVEWRYPYEAKQLRTGLDFLANLAESALAELQQWCRSDPNAPPPEQPFALWTTEAAASAQNGSGAAVSSARRVLSRRRRSEALERADAARSSRRRAGKTPASRARVRELRRRAAYSHST